MAVTYIVEKMGKVGEGFGFVIIRRQEGRPDMRVGPSYMNRENAEVNADLLRKAEAGE